MEKTDNQIAEQYVRDNFFGDKSLEPITEMQIIDAVLFGLNHIRSSRTYFQSAKMTHYALSVEAGNVMKKHHYPKAEDILHPLPEVQKIWDAMDVIEDFVLGELGAENE